MDTRWAVFASVLLINTAAALLIVFLLMRKPSAPGLTFLIYMLYMLAVWNFSYAMITLVPSLEAKRFWLKVENIGILFTPIFWFLFTVQYTRVDKWLNKYSAAVFFIIPLTTLIFIWSDSWFDFYYSAIHPVSGNIGPLVIERGWWYTVAAIHAYIVNITCIVLLIWQAFQFRDIYRRQMFALMGAALFPVLANIVYQLAPLVIPAFSMPVDLTPITFTITAALIAFGVFGLRIFDLIPIARHTVLERIPEMVFVVDVHNRVLDANSVAQKMLGKPMDQIIGGDVQDIFSQWPQLVDRFLKTNETREEIQIPGDPARTLDLVIFSLYNRFDKLEGRVIVAHDISERKWLENDLTYANQSLKNQLKEIEQLRALLQEQAIRDPLTNVYNRRYMAEFLDKSIAQAERENTPVSIVIIDMDHFKQFNDTYGHKCGDIVLQTFANFLVQHTRRSDVVCRYGGEEFVILMPNVSLETGWERAENWRQDFSEMIIPYEEIKFSATFSAGVATFPQHGTIGDAILQAADKALYQSKRSGRNRVSRFGD